MQDPWPALVAMLDGTNSAPPPRWPREQVRIVMDGRAQHRPDEDPLHAVFGRMPMAERNPARASDRELVRYMQRRGPVSGSELADWMRVPYKVARDRLQVLQAIGFVRHEGGFWHAVRQQAVDGLR
jgi:hypothetical protein